MGDKFHGAFHGNGWLTHKSTVAQALDTLDRISELCRAAPVTPGGGFRSTAEEQEDAPAIILDLCDDLSGELDAAEADLFDDIYGDPALRWSAFEMRLHLKEMRLVLSQEPESTAVIEKVADLTSRIRKLLRHIDQ